MQDRFPVCFSKGELQRNGKEKSGLSMDGDIFIVLSMHM